MTLTSRIRIKRVTKTERPKSRRGFDAHYHIPWSPDVRYRLSLLADAVRETESYLRQQGLLSPDISLQMDTERSEIAMTVYSALSAFAWALNHDASQITLDTFSAWSSWYLTNRSDRVQLSLTPEINTLINLCYERVSAMVNLPYMDYKGKPNAGLIVALAICYAYERHMKRTAR